MIKVGAVITIPANDRFDGTEAIDLLVTHVPATLHPRQEWVRIEGVELDDGVAIDLPTKVLVRAALLRELQPDGQRDAAAS